MDKEEVLNFTMQAEKMQQRAVAVAKIVNKINPKKYFVYDFSDIRLLTYPDCDVCSLVYSVDGEPIFDIPLEWLWLPHEEIEKRVKEEMREELIAKQKREAQKLQRDIASLTVKLENANMNLKSLTKEE